jgi:hypothetical protein
MMENYESIMATLALTMGASWASGINLYAALVVLGIGGSTGAIDLPPDLEMLANPLVIGAAAVMYLVEFVIDKVPGVDTAWDGISTFIRIPAGAILAAGAAGDVTPALEIASGVMGASLAATSHATKAGTRALINTSPEPFTNWGASITEDLTVIGGLWIALNHPVIFLCLLAVFLIFAIWLLPRIWRLLKAILRKIGSWVGLVDKAPSPGEPSINSPPQADSTGPPDNIAEQIASLQKLHAQGTLSEAEFQQAKKRLLGS